MRKLFGEEYATKCTRTGRGKGITTSVGNSELLNVLKSNETSNADIIINSILIITFCFYFDRSCKGV